MNIPKTLLLFCLLSAKIMMAGDLEWGIMGAINRARLGGSIYSIKGSGDINEWSQKWKDWGSENQITHQFRGGYQLGFRLNYAFTPTTRFRFGSGILFENINTYHSIYSEFRNWPGESVSVKMDLSNNYLVVPLTIQYAIFKHTQISIGLGAGVLINQKSRGEYLYRPSNRKKVSIWDPRHGIISPSYRVELSQSFLVKDHFIEIKLGAYYFTSPIWIDWGFVDTYRVNHRSLALGFTYYLNKKK